SARLPVGDGGHIRLNLPSALFVGRARSLREAVEVFAAWNLAEAHIMASRRHQLAVVECKAPMGEVPVENREPNLRGVRFARELRLGGEGPADGDPISAADKSSALVPHFEGMRVAAVV